MDAISQIRRIVINENIYTTVVATLGASPNITSICGVIYLSAIRVGALVTASVPMRFVIKSRSFFFLSRASVRAQKRFCFTYVCNLCAVMDISGISVPAKKASVNTSAKKTSKGRGSKGIKIENKLYFCEMVPPTRIELVSKP